eukprot:CAMPEP_0176479238 /NCGR_PEP_ID=MMETSP0200_2-20121128/1633_1 /TAXON_ID=947934 /ORGANISM="Chaetoceros sp., Strain GSL56" /LENGTH=443 /DNA_ID=CAMNT_0017875269 /DNA_START=69 /DNA_END=1400 /DNA_ORIENTATION=-
MNDPNASSSSSSSSQPTLDRAKIFVGGLSWQSTEETLRYHFEQYGEVVSVEVMRDRDTGNPRGFAFVVFQDDATVGLVMNNLPHEINHKIVDVKRAQARGSAPPSIHHHKQHSGGSGGASSGNHYNNNNNNNNNNNSQHHIVGGQEQEDSQIIIQTAVGTGTCTGSTAADNEDGSNNVGGGSSSTRELTPEELQNKIFVGGLPTHIDNVSLKEFFMQFGNVIDAIVMMDVAQGRSRGFGFVTFEDGSGGAQKALASQPLYIDNKYVEIKLAQPKGSSSSSSYSQNVDHGNKKYVHHHQSQNVGLRNANASLASLQSKGEFAGFAASYGRNGWKAGYGSYAFGKGGWAVQDWETFLDPPEKTGFSFDSLFLQTTTATTKDNGNKKKDESSMTFGSGSSNSGSSQSRRKRNYHEANVERDIDRRHEEHVQGSGSSGGGSQKRSRR